MGMGGVITDLNLWGVGGRSDCKCFFVDGACIFTFFEGMGMSGVIVDVSFWGDGEGRSDCRYIFLKGWEWAE